jgi:SAM-dependent methyltransferase
METKERPEVGLRENEGQGQIEQWNNLAEKYGLDVLAQRHILMPGIVKNVLPKIPSESTVLDIGCGNGVYSGLISSERKAHVVGVDISSDMIRQAKIANPDLEFLVGKIEDLNGGFDYVFANMLLCNLGKKLVKSFFISAHKLLISGGRLSFTNVSPEFQKTCTTDYLEQTYPESVDEGCEIQVRLKTGQDSVIGPFSNFHYSSEYLADLAIEAGFSLDDKIDLSSVEEGGLYPQYRLMNFIKN